MAEKKCFEGRAAVTDTGGLLIMLDLSSLDLPKTFQYQNKEWTIKNEFHITLVGFSHKLPQVIQSQQHVNREEATQTTQKLLKEASDGISFTICLGNKLMHAKRAYQGRDGEQIRETIVLSCDAEGPLLFYNKLLNDYRITISPPPFHVTLYTLNNDESKKGIGLANEGEVRKFAVIIPGDEVPKILKRKLWGT